MWVPVPPGPVPKSYEESKSPTGASCVCSDHNRFVQFVHRSLFTVHCSLCFVLCALCNVDGATRAPAQITIDSCSLRTVHCSLFIVRCALSFVLCTMSMGATRAHVQITIGL